MRAGALALARPESELAFWLVRVATNLALDALRRRKRRAYTGPWLPAPVELAATEPDAGARDGRLESATFAFLIALEALGPALAHARPRGLRTLATLGKAMS